MAQDAKRFLRALNSGNERSLDRWTKRLIHDQRIGHPVSTSGPTSIRHAPTFDSLVAFMRRLPGVENAAWKGCTSMMLIWPGYNTIGLRWHNSDEIRGCCWTVQEGMPGTANLLGGHLKVQKDSYHLKYKRANSCACSVEQQWKCCD